MRTHIARFTSAAAAVDPGLLSTAELTRRDRLLRPEDRRAYVAAHVLVRRCAAELLAVPVTAIELVQVCEQCGQHGHGRPAIVGRPQVGVSLSHSRQHVAAIAAWGAVGIDVETLTYSTVVEDVLSERERAWLSRQPDSGRAFRRLWVRKEALMKSGLATLDQAASIDVLVETAGAGPRPDDVRFTEWSTVDAVGAWTVRDPRRHHGDGRHRSEA